MAEMNRNLWAPWRMQYIHGLNDPAAPADENTGCFLCRYIAHPGKDAEHHVLWRRPRTLTVFNAFPYSPGHLLIAPLEHVGELEAMDAETLGEMMIAARDGTRLLTAVVRAQGFNIGLNLGRCAGAGLPGHVHLHVVPRWEGDNNFMSVLADIRVVSQNLQTLYEQMQAAAPGLGLPPVGRSAANA